jgi:hypothetical protein
MRFVKTLWSAKRLMKFLRRNGSWLSTTQTVGLLDLA